MALHDQHDALHDLHDHMVQLLDAQSETTHKLSILTKRGILLMETMQTLQQKIDELTAAQAAEAQRQQAQDAATASQIAALQAALESLQNAGGMSPENQAILDAAVPRIQAVINSLNAEQPMEVPPTQ